MDKTEISILRTLGYGLSETSERSDGAIMTVGAARELGRLIMEMVSDNQRMADVVLLYGQMRKDFALLEGRAERVSRQCVELIKERDSLKAERDELKGKIGGAAEMQREYLKRAELAEEERDSLKVLHEKETASLSGLMVEIQKERDSFKAELAAACDLLGQSRANEENAAREVGRLDEALRCANESARDLIKERDSLRGQFVIADAGIGSLTKERDSLREELRLAVSARVHLENLVKRDESVRESLNKNLDAAQSERASKCDELERVRDNLRRIHSDLDDSNKRLSAALAERDALKESIKKPLVQFAVELERMNNEAAREIADALEAKKTIGAIA